jgi:hypothetical protein
MTVVAGEYVTFKHVKTRKCVVLEVEVPEEEFEAVIEKLGMPVGGNSKPVAIALLDESKVTKAPKVENDNKMVTRAVMLCKETAFQRFAVECGGIGDELSEDNAADYIKYYCDVNSRSELKDDIDAQRKFVGMVEGYKYWLNN